MLININAVSVSQTTRRHLADRTLGAPFDGIWPIVLLDFFWLINHSWLTRESYRVWCSRTPPAAVKEKSLTMSVPFGRSVVIPASFILCAIAVTFAPAVNVSFSLFLIVLGIAVSTIVYSLWHEPPVAVALVEPSIDTDRRESTGSR
jgi:hypothetical protein